MTTYDYSDSKGTYQIFSSTKDNLTHVVLFPTGKIAAKCSSLELAQKARNKDERLYDIQGMTIVSLDKVENK